MLLFVLYQAHLHHPERKPGHHAPARNPAAQALVGLVILGALLAVKTGLSVSRTRHLERVAGELGAEFEAEPASSPLSSDAEKLQLFQLGILPRLENLLILTGTEPAGSCFDYSYVLRNELGPNVRTGMPVDNRLGQTVVALRWNEARWPALKVAGKAWLGEPDDSQKEISLQDAPDFSRHYRVWGDDEARVRELLTSEARSLLEQNPGLTVEGRGDTLLVYRPYKLVAPGEVAGLVRLAGQVAAALGK